MAHNLLKQKLEERCTNLTAAFRKVDKSNNGFITPADFSEVMASFGIRVTRPSLMAIVAKYDANGDGFVSYQEFCATMAGKPPSKRLATAPKIAAPAATSRAEEVTAAKHSSPKQPAARLPRSSGQAVGAKSFSETPDADKKPEYVNFLPGFTIDAIKPRRGTESSTA